MAASPEEAPQPRPVPIKRTNPLGLRPAFANDCTVSHSNAEFFITFGQIEPPLILSVNDLEHVESIESTTVAKLAVTPEFMEILIETLSANLGKYKEKHS